MRSLNPNSVLWSLIVTIGFGLFAGALMYFLLRNLLIFFLVVALAVFLGVAVNVLLEVAHRADVKRSNKNLK